jgi:hypothetical protein
MTTHQPITSDMTIDQRAAARAANYARFASNLRAFAAHQEARAPGRMDHITGDILKAAAVCETISAAYAAGDKETVAANREAFGLLSMNATVSSGMEFAA